MPYIEIVTNVSAGKERIAELAGSMGKAIELMPGKSEKWLAVHVEDLAELSFGGDGDRPAAVVTVKAFGAEQSDGCYDALSGVITDSCSALLGVEPERIYVEYEQTRHWGWNGKNFSSKG